jgi:zinc D-Ala-D-Ala carboxypeptidase
MTERLVNIYDSIPSARNFTYYELIRSDTAVRFDIDNYPNIEQLGNIENLAKFCLQPIRDNFGPIRVTSGFRCPELNYLIGGSPNSNHCRGEAADIIPLNSGATLMTIIEWVYRNLEFRELIAEFFPDGWIHVAYRRGGNNRQLKLKDSLHNYQKLSFTNLSLLYPDF